MNNDDVDSSSKAFETDAVLRLFSSPFLTDVFADIFSLPQVWDAIISQASKNVEFLKDLQAVKQLGNILKTNVRACKALGHPFVHQLGKIYLDMLNVYKVNIWDRLM